MKRANLRRSIFLPTVILFFLTAILTGASLTYSQQQQQQGPPKDWTEKELKAFLDKPYSPAEKAKMGDVEIEKLVPPLVYKKGLSTDQLFKNGMHFWMPIMLQYGIDMNSKDFHKLWIEQEGWKNPKIILVDVRQEGEYNAAHIPGAIRVDTGLFYWQSAKVGLLPDPDADYYLCCKSGYPPDGGVRGALVKRMMLQMGYSGKIVNITDGFRGWMENGYPVENVHGLFNFVKGTFQKSDTYSKK